MLLRVGDGPPGKAQTFHNFSSRVLCFLRMSPREGAGVTLRAIPQGGEAD